MMKEQDVKGQFFCSWSGGKDSCLSLYRAIREGLEPRLLLTMLTEEGDRSRSHGLSIGLIKEQARSLNMPLVVRSASWSSYEEQFTGAIGQFIKDGIEVGVFGDIDLDEHREWAERVCSCVGIKPYHPLWKERRRGLLDEFIKLGFKAVIVSVKDAVMSRQYLGRILDRELADELEGLGIDPCGEEGEFHTVVVDGPLFRYPINIELKGQVLMDGYWFQDISI